MANPGEGPAAKRDRIIATAHDVYVASMEETRLEYVGAKEEARQEFEEETGVAG